MKGAPKLDGRRAPELDAELRRRALAVLSGDGRSPPLGTITEAFLATAARIGEEVTRRIDMAPAKQADNFYNAAGIGRDPARPAKLPVAFVLSDGAKAVVSAPAQTQLMVDADGPVIFETETRIDLAPGTVAALRGLDAQRDAIEIPAASVMIAALPRVAPITRRLRSGAAAGAAKIQIDPAAGLEPGTLLLLGAGEAAREYLAAGVEGDLVTLEPALEGALPENSPVVEVADFRPFAESTRNHQAHALYLGHAKLLDIPSAVTITVTGTALPADAKWSWWGQIGEDDPPAWQALSPNDGATLSFTKAKGKPAKKKIGTRESLWLRAELPGKSLASSRARDVRIAIGDTGLCTSARDTRCKTQADAMNVGYEAIANTTPIVTNRAFHPFGREPRLYDSFYIGSNEAFSKAGAEISLCFEFGGADLGPMKVVNDALGAQVFGVGTGGVAYRGDFRAGAATLMALPPPTDQSASPMASHAALDAWLRGGQIVLAAAATGAVQVAVLGIDSKLDAASIKWIRLPVTGSASRRISRVAMVDSSLHSAGKPPPSAAAGTAPLLADGPAPMVDGLEEADSAGPGRLWRWTDLGAAAPLAELVAKAVDDLISVQTLNSPGDKALVWIEHDEQGYRLTLIFESRQVETQSLDKSWFPARCRTAWLGSEGAFKYLYVAGYDEGAKGPLLRLVRFTVGATELIAEPERDWMSAEPIDRLPATFSLAGATSSASTLDQRLQLSVALETPRHFHISGGELVSIEEPYPIGADSNDARMMVSAAGKTFVQRSNAGLRYRPASADGGAFTELQFPIASNLYVAPADQLPAEPLYAIIGTNPQGSGYTFSTETGDYRQLIRLSGSKEPVPEAEYRFLQGTRPAANATKTDDRELTLVSAPTESPITVLLEKWDADGHRTYAGIWKLTLAPPPKPPAKKKPAAADEPEPAPPPPAEPARTIWTTEQDLPKVKSSERLDYVLLGQIAPIGLIEAVALADPAAFNAALEAGPLFAENPPTQVTGTVKLTSGEVLLLDHDQVEDHMIRLFRAPEPWRDLGPSEPANPALSWEYWNGESWWALAARELVDQTANFQQSGGVFFTVPADIEPTDVAGRTEHWLRVRLAGGDYGEAKVTVVGQPGAAPNTTEQTVIRDVSTVRAPYITALRLGYCAIQPVRPDIVLTEDSLGTIDQTSANEAGLEFPVFTPVAELMNPVDAAEATAEAAAASDSCDDPCPAPASSQPGPCAAPGAYESCDSPCIPPPGYRGTAGGAAAGFVRGLMIGFTKPFAGDTVSLYIDAEPAGPPVELVADILRGGRFTPVNLVKDTSYGLTESGILTLALPGPPDTSDLFGASAHWLRLWPKSDPSTWAPQLRGIHLNAVMARSIETREMEPLGQSIGAADQEFRLTEPPVDPRSLELRVRELLSDEDRANPELDIATYEAGPTGEWVLWSATEDLVDVGDPQRVYVLDAEGGVVRFGDGATGRIPPLAADILAARYAHVTGSKANVVEPGKQLQTLSPLAGVEKALALDNAAGGSDAEALESARQRAAAKVRHGGRILSRADIEDYAPTLSPGIAQVRAEKKGGGTRLVIVMGGAEPRPSPAQLRGFGDAIRDVAGYGIARPGGLSVVAPRLMPLAVDLVLRPRTPDLFAEAAEQAKAALLALFDPATGNHDGKGWPLGRLPDEQDIAAALIPIEDLALPESVTLERADKETSAERTLPDGIPSDVLVRLDAADIALERAQEQAA
jgi:hypothetical protein